MEKQIKIKTDKQRFFEALEDIDTYRFVRQGKKRFLVREVAFEPEMHSTTEIKKYGNHVEFLEDLAEHCNKL